MNKYSNVLTMLLVVFIVAIFGIIIYFAYDLLNSNKINKDAQTAMEELEKSMSNVKRDVSTTTKNESTNEITNSVDIDELMNKISEIENQKTTNTVSQEGQQKVYMDKYEVLGEIEIPKTNCKYPILDSVTSGALEKSVGLVTERSTGLNNEGNNIIFGHNYRNGLFFSNNKKLSKGDLIYITDKSGQKITYEIYNIYQTTQDDADYMVRDTEGRKEISLQTCTDDGANRIIIWAKEKF